MGKQKTRVSGAAGVRNLLARAESKIITTKLSSSDPPDKSLATLERPTLPLCAGGERFRSKNGGGTPAQRFSADVAASKNQPTYSPSGCVCVYAQRI